MYDNDDDTAAYCDWLELSTDSLCVGSCLHNNIQSVHTYTCSIIHTYTFQVCLTFWSKESITFLIFCIVAFVWKFGLAKNYKVIINT